MKKDKVVGITFGAFDLMHAGHCIMFEDAKQQCDYLIVGLHVDPSIERPEKHKPVQSVQERYIQLVANRNIDKVIPYHTELDLLEMLIKIKPDIRIIGSDWKGKEFTGHKLKIPVYFHSRNHNFSSSELRKRIAEAELAKKNMV